jgi:hypothetical protein
MMERKSEASRVSIEGLRTEHFSYLGEVNALSVVTEVGKFMNVQ